jgi:hypothetical protein
MPWEGSLQCPSFLAPIVKRGADTLARSRVESWFSAWRWRRLRPMRPWAEPVALHPEQAGTPKRLIARMVQRNLRPVLMAWFGTPRIKDAWPGTAGCGLAPELIEIRVCAWLSRRRTKKLALLGPATGPRSASDSAPGRQPRRSSLASVLARRAQRNRSLFVIPLTGSFERAMRSRSRRGKRCGQNGHRRWHCHRPRT